MKMSTAKTFLNIYKNTIRPFSTKSRKRPIDPIKADQLPVFEYGVSNSAYNRLYVWGAVQTGALGIPYDTKRLRQIEQIKYPKRSSLAEYNEVTMIGCGFGFTVAGVNTDSGSKVYGTGLNTDSQLGYHEIRTNKPLGIIYFPQQIHLPYLNPETVRIKKLSGGRAHLLVLTNEGMFLLGNNAYGQCGRKIIADECYSGNKFIHHIKNIDGKTVIDIQCGQDHTLAITEDGSVYSCGWGADGQTGLGHFNCQDKFTKVQGDIASERILKVASRSDFVLALNDKGEVFGWGNTEYAQIPSKGDIQQVANPTYIEMCKSLGKIKDIASGGSFCVVLNEEGRVFVWGYGILGTGPAVQCSKIPLEIPLTLFGVNDFQPDTRIKSITCGVNHVCAVTNNGDLYTWGRNKGGCLGLKDDKDQYFPLRVALSGYVRQVGCGVDHTVALCKPFI